MKHLALLVWRSRGNNPVLSVNIVCLYGTSLGCQQVCFRVKALSSQAAITLRNSYETQQAAFPLLDSSHVPANKRQEILFNRGNPSLIRLQMLSAHLRDGLQASWCHGKAWWTLLPDRFCRTGRRFLHCGASRRGKEQIIEKRSWQSMESQDSSHDWKFRFYDPPLREEEPIKRSDTSKCRLYQVWGRRQLPRLSKSNWSR